VFRCLQTVHKSILILNETSFVHIFVVIAFSVKRSISQSEIGISVVFDCFIDLFSFCRIDIFSFFFVSLDRFARIFKSFQ
jgi:hypothetical protein